MTGCPDFDHTSFAVRDAMSWARLLRRTLGATPIAGEALPEFRYLLMYVGTVDAGSRIEFIEPAGDGFLTRYLTRHGEGPHHITFTVPDLRTTVAKVRALGATVIGENYDHPAWREAFIVPTSVHGVVIQLAQSEAEYPSPVELLATTRREVEGFPTTAGATEKRWWVDLWTTAVEASAVLGPTHLSTTDLSFTRRLFEGVLGAEVAAHEHGLEFRWPSGTLRTRVRSPAGVTGLAVNNDFAGVPTIGTARLHSLVTKGLQI